MREGLYITRMHTNTHTHPHTCVSIAENLCINKAAFLRANNYELLSEVDNSALPVNWIPIQSRRVRQSRGIVTPRREFGDDQITAFPSNDLNNE